MTSRSYFRYSANIPSAIGYGITDPGCSMNLLASCRTLPLENFGIKN